MSVLDELASAQTLPDLERLADRAGLHIIERRIPPTCSDWWTDVENGEPSGTRLDAILVACDGARHPVLLVRAGLAPERRAVAVRRAVELHLGSAVGDPDWLVHANGMRYQPLHRER